MAKTFYHLYKNILELAAVPVLFAYFFRPEVGKEYHIGFRDKIRLLHSFRRTTTHVETASSWQEHAYMAAKILQIPASQKGDIIECGSYKGGSTANLSLVCALTDRKLYVYDSFEGLPEPRADDAVHVMDIKEKHKEYKKGQYAGSLEEVKKHIETYGNLETCTFVKGYFEKTLPSLASTTQTLVFVFIDVDLYASLETCLRYLWPHLAEGCYFFSHEAQDMPFTSLFFNEQWWQKNLATKAPGFIGAGTGLPLGVGEGSSIGYTKKIS